MFDHPHSDAHLGDRASALTRFAVAAGSLVAVETIALVVFLVVRDATILVAMIANGAAGVLAALWLARRMGAPAGRLDAASEAPVPRSSSQAGPGVAPALAPAPPVHVSTPAAPPARTKVAIAGGGWADLNAAQAAVELPQQPDGLRRIYYLTRNGTWIREQWYGAQRDRSFFASASPHEVAGDLVEAGLEDRVPELLPEVLDSAEC